MGRFFYGRVRLLCLGVLDQVSEDIEDLAELSSSARSSRYSERSRFCQTSSDGYEEVRRAESGSLLDTPNLGVPGTGRRDEQDTFSRSDVP